MVITRRCTFGKRKVTMEWNVYSVTRCTDLSGHVRFLEALTDLHTDFYKNTDFSYSLKKFKQPRSNAKSRKKNCKGADSDERIESIQC